MIDDKTLFEIQCNIIGFLLKHRGDIDKISITEDYFKDFTDCNFKYVFKKIRDLHKQGQDDNILIELTSDKNINQIFLSKPLEAMNMKTWVLLERLKKSSSMHIKVGY